jgi:ribosome-associated translation inhibitor RaiA
MSPTKRSVDTTHNPLGEYVLHVGAGFTAKDRPHVLQELATLGSHLGRWNPQDVSLEVSLQDRGRREQRVTLRTTLPGLPPLVSVAGNRDITRALHEARRELIRQVEHQKSARQPMHNRKLGRDTIRHPGASPPL